MLVLSNSGLIVWFLHKCVSVCALRRAVCKGHEVRAPAVQRGARKACAKAPRPFGGGVAGAVRRDGRAGVQRPTFRRFSPDASVGGRSGPGSGPGSGPCRAGLSVRSKMSRFFFPLSTAGGYRWQDSAVDIQPTAVGA